jgi:hypothetical protein
VGVSPDGLENRRLELELRTDDGLLPRVANCELGLITSRWLFDDDGVYVMSHEYEYSIFVSSYDTVILCSGSLHLHALVTDLADLVSFQSGW